MNDQIAAQALVRQVMTQITTTPSETLRAKRFMFLGRWRASFNVSTYTASPANTAGSR